MLTKNLLLGSLILTFALSSQAQSTKSSQNCTFEGVPLYGKVQVVNSFPDFKVQVVNHFPDLKVKTVNSFPKSCGKWQFVNSFPDFKVQFVNSFPDFKIQFVQFNEGLK